MESQKLKEAGPTQKSWTISLVLSVFNLIGKLPWRFRQNLGWIIGYLYGCCPTKERRTAELQIAAFLPEANPHNLARRVFASIGQTFAESLNIRPAFACKRYRFECSNPELLSELSSKSLTDTSRAALGLTGHTGNWELCAAYLRSHGIPLIAIGRPARNEKLHQALVQLRQHLDVPMIWRVGWAGVRQIREAFNTHKVVAALVDQDTRVSSVSIPFFGRPAQTPSSVVDLAKRYNAQIVTCFLVRTSPTSFYVYLNRVDQNLDTKTILKIFNGQLEALIRKYPEQWVWFHKRWASLPNGERMSSREYREWLEGLKP